MHPIYEKNSDKIDVFTMRNQHYPPHLHPFLECIYVQKGFLALGQGTELYPMYPGDFALIFPDTLHHYQVFGDSATKSVFLMATAAESGIFEEVLSSHIAKFPVIPSDKVDPEVRHALRTMLALKESPYQKELLHAYLQIILAKCLPHLEFADKQLLHSQDIVYNVVSYISSHFKDEVSLNSMASDLAVSPYVLSRVFSGTFHTNFNTYLNEYRLRYAKNLLKYSDTPIIDIALESGFSSLRTFNRFFKEKLRTTPREFRAQFLKTLAAGEADPDGPEEETDSPKTNHMK